MNNNLRLRRHQYLADFPPLALAVAADDTGAAGFAISILPDRSITEKNVKPSFRIMFSLSALLIAAAPAHSARPSKPLTLFNDNPISTTSGKSLSTTEIDQAIIRAGKTRLEHHQQR